MQAQPRDAVEHVLAEPCHALERDIRHRESNRGRARGGDPPADLDHEPRKAARLGDGGFERTIMRPSVNREFRGMCELGAPCACGN